VIVRQWAARLPPEHLNAYVAHVRTQVVPQLRSLDGYLGASVLERTADSEIEVVVETRWRSLEAIEAFAGHDVEQAVVEDAAARLLTRFDDRVKHFEVTLEDDTPT
jgi:heme-degrading monooxygenase HmoA